MYKIDRNVPLPPTQRRRTTKYPWPEMKLGDSFFIPNGKEASTRSVASNAGAKYNKRYTARKVEGGVRVWRVK